jgi:hypothetical protein
LVDEIAIFGCSFSRGVPEVSNYDCWPRHLAKAFPNVQIKNYAMSGSSLLYSLYALEKYKQQVRNAYTIFNITTPFRFDYIPQDTDLDDFLIDTDLPNYKQTDMNRLSDKITPFRYQNCLFSNVQKPKEQRKFGKLLAKYFNDEMDEIQWKACSIYANDHTDFTFFQRAYRSFPENFCVERDFGKKWYKKHSPDQYHLDSDGLEILTNKIIDLTKLKNIV